MRENKIDIYSDIWDLEVLWNIGSVTSYNLQKLQEGSRDTEDLFDYSSLLLFSPNSKNKDLGKICVIIQFLMKGIIKKLIIEKNGKIKEITKKYIQDNSYIEEEIYFPLDTIKEFEGYFKLKMEVDFDECINSIKNHIESWKRENYLILDTSIRKSEIQIKDIISNLHELLNSFPEENLIVKKEIDINKLDEYPNAYEYFYCLIFLHDINVIDLIKLKIKTEGNKNFLIAKINILEKFFDYFEKTKVSNNEVKKINLYWDEKNKIFKINKQLIDVSKSTHQFDALKILFEEQPLKNDLSFKEIYNFLDPSGSLDLHKATKRYSNATNNLNNKIQKITGIESIFKTTRQLVGFNPKYTFNFQIIS